MPNAKRRKVQEEAIDDMVASDRDSSPGFSFHEIGTGGGKTLIGLEAAKQIVESGKSVVISAPNNFLLFSYVDEWVKWGGDAGDVEVVIGQDNYVRPSIALSPEFLNQFSLQREEVEQWIEHHDGRSVVSLFVRDFLLNDEAESILKGDTPIISGDGRILDDERQSLQDVAQRIQEGTGKIYLTNHFYLIYLLLYGTDNGFSTNVTIIADEVHLLNNTARSIFRNDFSPYRLNFLLSQALRDKVFPAAHIAKVRRVSKGCGGIMAETASVSDINKINGDMAKAMLHGHFNRKEVLAISGVVARLGKKHSDSKMLRSIQKELDELLSVMGSEGRGRRDTDIEVSFSSIKKYPTFSVFKKDPIGNLRKMFMHNNDVHFIGMSGTIRCSTSDGIEDNRWSFDRLGLRMAQWDEESEAVSFFNEKVASMRLFVYDRIFRKEQLRYHIEYGKRFSVPAWDTWGRDARNREALLWDQWIESHAQLIKDSFEGSGVILMSSFENTEAMVAALEKNGFAKEYRIFSHKRDTPFQKSIEQYKIAVKIGEKAVLVGGLPLYTGINLPGRFLDTLYISKIPNEPTSDYFKKRGGGHYSYQKDMIRSALITFRQGIGRTIRTPDDKALVIVADPRIRESRYRVFLDFLEESGVPVSQRD